MRRIVILTGSELRHSFVSKALGLQAEIEVQRTYCEESLSKTLAGVKPHEEGGDGQRRHLAMRAQSERDYFGAFDQLVPDHSNAVFIPRGSLNTPMVQDEIRRLAPDLLCAFGCSIVQEPLLSEFKGRFLNVHLGLSPYYRGGGTNFWPLVNGEPEFVGATFMYIDAGVDTGEIIHQIRAEIYPGDNVHSIGNRLISRIPATYAQIIRCLSTLEHLPQPPAPANRRYYRRADFSPASVEACYRQFEDGMIEKYLAAKDARLERSPIVQHRRISGAQPDA